VVEQTEADILAKVIERSKETYKRDEEKRKKEQLKQTQKKKKKYWTNDCCTCAFTSDKAREKTWSNERSECVIKGCAGCLSLAEGFMALAGGLFMMHKNDWDCNVSAVLLLVGSVPLLVGSIWCLRKAGKACWEGCSKGWA
jgi:hypothetical protein